MDMTLSDYDGRTALHLAAAEGHLNCVQFMLEQCSVPHNPKDRWLWKFCVNVLIKFNFTFYVNGYSHQLRVNKSVPTSRQDNSSSQNSWFEVRFQVEIFFHLLFGYSANHFPTFLNLVNSLPILFHSLFVHVLQADFFFTDHFT